MKKSLIATAAFASALSASAVASPSTAIENSISRNLCIEITPTVEFCSSASREPYNRTNENGSPLFIIPDGYLNTPEGRQENCTLLVDENYKAEQPPFCASQTPETFMP